MAESNKELVRELIRDGYLKSPLLIGAFRAIDRKDFVPREYWNEAYGNYPLPIGQGQTISQPLTVAFMLELLSPEPGEKILDVGSGSGWATALLAYCVSQKGGRQNLKIKNKNSGKINTIERIPELAKIAEKNILKYNFIKKGIVKIILGDGSRGHKAGAPYDKIIAAATGEEIPRAWKAQLKIGGRIVAPVGKSIVVADKISERRFGQKEYFGFNFVPLVKN